MGDPSSKARVDGGAGPAAATSAFERLLPRGSRRRAAARRLKQAARGLARTVRPDRGTRIFIACFQKSGSTYLTKLLAAVTGFPDRALVAGYGHNEQDVSACGLEEMAYRSLVSQQHARGTDNNVDLLLRFDVRPVVLVRNIFDVVVSLYDHVERGRYRVPTGYVHRQYFEMSRNEKLMYLIRIHLPWYFNFYVSWREAAARIDVLWLTYEELFSDQEATVERVLRFYRLPADRERIREAISETTRKRETIRFNVGVSGRGATLPDRHKKAVHELAEVWRVDAGEMGAIGIL